MPEIAPLTRHGSHQTWENFFEVRYTGAAGKSWINWPSKYTNTSSKTKLSVTLTQVSCLYITPGIWHETRNHKWKVTWREKSALSMRWQYLILIIRQNYVPMNTLPDQPQNLECDLYKKIKIKPNQRNQIKLWSTNFKDHLQDSKKPQYYIFKLSF